jgi:hypothetical protein
MVSMSASTCDPVPGNKSLTILRPVDTDLIFMGGFQ